MYILALNEYIFDFFLKMEIKLRSSFLGFLLNTSLCFRDLILDPHCYAVYLMRIRRGFVVGFHFL